MRAALLIFAAFVLSGCGSLQWPPPEKFPPGASSRGASAQPGFVGQARTVTVRDGETLFTLSKRTGVAARAIIEANNLQPPYRIARGQTLTLPGMQTHTVIRGDTLYGISRHYGVDVYELARLNNLQSPYTIRVNQSLILPGGVPRPPTGVETVDRTGATGAPAPRAVSVEPVEVRAAPLSAPPASTTRVEPAALPPPAERPAAAPAPEPEKTRIASLPRAVPSARGTGRFIWPVEGKLASEYGPKGEGLHNDGINIVAPRGTPVRAAAPGVVAYAGNEIRGFGNLLLIQHPDGWMTAYAHNDKLLVKRGDRVQQGQQIGAVGATGNVTSSQLHFEIRRGKRAVDPLDQLGTPPTS